MTRFVRFAARSAAPTLFLVGALLASGAVMIALGQPAIGWTVYGVGYVGALPALAAVAAFERHTAGRFGWIPLAIVSAGVAMGLPELLMVWGLYAEIPAVHDLFMPYATAPVVAVSGIVAWAGVLLFGALMTAGRRLPTGAGLLVILAAFLALPFEFRIAPQIAWVVALVLLFVAVAWIAVARGRPRQPFPPSLDRGQPRGLPVTGR